MKNYYKILEVNNDASDEVISKVYRFLAKKYHPDMYEDKLQKEQAETKFKEISEAYEVLSDKQKREEFDAQLKEYELSKIFEEYNEKLNTNSLTVSMEDYQNLQNYCITLETKLNNLYTQIKNYNKEQENMHSYTTNNYNDTQNYYVPYTKTFKDSIKHFFAIVISLLFMVTALYCVFKVPFFRKLFFYF